MQPCRYSEIVSSEIFKPRNIIVTGGCGFIGANFVRYVALMIIVVSCFWLYSKVFHFWETCRLPSFFTRHLQAPKNNLDCPHRPTTTGRSMMLIRDLPPTIGARTHTVYPRGSQ